jgi:hypothetical protein
MMASLSKGSTSPSPKLKPGLLSPAESGPEKSKSINEGDPALPKRTPPPEAAQRGHLEFLQSGVGPTPPTLQNRKPPFRSFRTPVLSRPPYLRRSKKLTRLLRTKDGAAHGPRCPRLHAAAFEEEGAKRPMAKGGPISTCEGRCRRFQQAARTRVAVRRQA